MITSAFQDAWVIHKSWSGDTSARVVFFTKENGLVSCLYKGGRTPKKQALLQAFIPLWLSMDIRGDAYFVHKLEVASSSIPLVGQTLFAGLYVNELLHHALKPHDPHATLHTVYIHALQALMTAFSRVAIEKILRRFEWALLTACGYSMSLTHDARSTQPILVNHFYRFIAGEGFVLADDGISGAHIIAMSQDKLDDLTVLNVAKWIMRRAIEHALDGKVIKTRALYRS